MLKIDFIITVLAQKDKIIHFGVKKMQRGCFSIKFVLIYPLLMECL